MSKEKITAQPVILQAPDSGAGQHYEEVRLPLTEKELARERLRAKVDVLTEAASVRAQLQAEPIKMLGGASAVGAVLGLALGSQLKRTERVYVDANSPAQYQKRLIQAQKKEQGQDLGGALFGTLVAVGVRALGSKLVRDKLASVADDLMAQATGEKPAGKSKVTTLSAANGRSAVREERIRSNPAADRFTRGSSASKAAAGQPATYSPATGGDQIGGAATPTVQAGVSQIDVSESGPVRNAKVPGSHVTEKADGSLIQRGELRNPNQN